METEPVLNSSRQIQSRRTAGRSRAPHRLRRAATLFVVFSLSGAARSLCADDAPLRNERAQLWAELAQPSRQVSPVDMPPLILPVRGVTPATLRDSFESPRSHGRRHAAIDIMAPRNTPVVAAVDGEIRKLTTSAGGGLTIYQFDESESRVFYYAHLQRYREGLCERTFVRRGEIIGYVGSSGNADRHAPHLHFAIHELPSSKELWKGAPVDPFPLLVVNTPLEARVSAPVSGE